jgi:hypothetical protein
MWPADTLAYVGGGQMAPRQAAVDDCGCLPALPTTCLTTVTPEIADVWLRQSSRATLRPVVLLDPNGIVAGAQAARFMVLTGTVTSGVLRRVDTTEGWAITAAEVMAAFVRGDEPAGPDMPAIIMGPDERVIHGADVLSELRVPTTVVVVIEEHPGGLTSP